MRRKNNAVKKEKKIPLTYPKVESTKYVYAFVKYINDVKKIYIYVYKRMSKMFFDTSILIWIIH